MQYKFTLAKSHLLGKTLHFGSWLIELIDLLAYLID
jgi:hypothetical protein